MKKSLKIIIIFTLASAFFAAAVFAFNAFVFFSAKDIVFEKADFAHI